MLRFWLLLLLCLILPGCMTLYKHPTKTQTEFHADSSSCEAMAGQAAGVQDPYGFTRQRVYKQCMQGKGWTPEERQ